MFLIPINEIEELFQNKLFILLDDKKRDLILVLVISSNFTLGSCGGSMQCKAGSQPS